MDNTLKVVGLGPGGMNYLTLEALETLESAEVVYLRTEKHPVIDKLRDRGMRFESYDHFYEAYETFDEVYLNVARDVIGKVDAGDVVYAVPGNPFVAEKTVEHLQEMAEAQGVNIEFVHGASFIDAIVTRLKRDPVHGLKIMDALQIEVQAPDVTMDNMIIQVYDRMTASRVKLALGKYYEDDQPVIVVRGAGIPGEERVETLPLYELDQRDGLHDHLTSLYIPGIEMGGERKRFFEDLVGIMEILRSPDGCPWDREQTHESLKPYLIEEAYEVLDAIDREDLFELEEELGDLLLQVVFHATIAEESGYFNIHDVTTGICEKLIRRHPHVFAQTHVEGSEEVLVNWEAIKKEEKKESLHIESMERIPSGMPALMRAYKIQKKAADVGFDWDDIKDAIAKIHEELDEFLEIYESGDLEKTSEELGDLFFAVVNVCRFLKVRPEVALSRTNEKFLRRFRFIEEKSLEKGKDLNNMTLEEMDNLWNMAKKLDYSKKN